MGVPLIRLERELPPNPEAAREARVALGELAPHVPSPHFDDLRLLVTELVTNSVRHGRLGAGDAIHLLGRIADRWGIKVGPWTCVWFEIDLSSHDDPTEGRNIENS